MPPIGKLEGIDPSLSEDIKISEIMFDEYREERYAPPPLLKRIVAMGRYGRKTGQGFYDWGGEKPVPLPV